jgi:predicted Zn-dependent protease
VRLLKIATRLRPLLLLGVASCLPFPLTIPAITDESLENFVNREAAVILQVAENSERAAMYQFRLANFPRKDILGLSVSRQRIFISYELARLASRNEQHRWLLRQTLAHEIAHEVLGGDVVSPGTRSLTNVGLTNRINARDLGLSGFLSFRPYSRSAELEADRKGMEYWAKLGWDCRIWIRIFRNFLKQGYHGDVDHPTVERLDQANRLCPAKPASD